MNSTLSARRTTNPTQKSESVFSLWALPFFFFLLSVGWGGGQRNHAACLPRLFLNGLLFVLLRMHFQSHPQLPYLQNFQKNKRLTSSLSTLAIFFLEFPFAGPKAQRSVSALEDEFVSLLNALFHKRKKNIASFNLWVILIFALHLSFPLCFFSLHASESFRTKPKAATVEPWVRRYRHDHSFPDRLYKNAVL